ncbi:MAG: hypothetical protein Q8K70_12950 [Bacteroidota bacterium]|nr:hypothetical protein [Bacteroidota bacterium]
MILEERYKILIDARNFHYDNFSKWMTYFYVAIGALFIGYCTILSSNKTLPMLEYLLPILGFIVSVLWYWSAKGYYYWIINFINLVNYYEKDLLKFETKERVYFVFANKKTQNNYGSPLSGANISTSKVTILFAFLVAVSWGFIFYNKVFTDNFCNCFCSIFLQIILSLSTVMILSFCIPINFLQSKNDHFPDLELKVD